MKTPSHIRMLLLENSFFLLNSWFSFIENNKGRALYVQNWSRDMIFEKKRNPLIFSLILDSCKSLTQLIFYALHFQTQSFRKNILLLISMHQPEPSNSCSISDRDCWHFLNSLPGCLSASDETKLCLKGLWTDSKQFAYLFTTVPCVLPYSDPDYPRKYEVPGRHQLS